MQVASGKKVKVCTLISTFTKNSYLMLILVLTNVNSVFIKY